MSKLFFSFIVLVSLSGLLTAQNSGAIQFNAGAALPINSSKGFTTSLQYNYPVSQSVQLYAYSGISYWDENQLVYVFEHSNMPAPDSKVTCDTDEHVLIPLYIGSRFNLHADRLFTTFLTLELGYSHLSYNTYENYEVVSEKTGETVDYLVDPNSKRKVNENLFGIGTGFGISHEITRGMELMLFFKLNSFVNSNYTGFFTSRGTYNTAALGINYGI